MIEINRYVLHSKPCGDAFERMFWACFWILDFRVRIDGIWINLLPDIVGWMLVVSALSRILDLSPVVINLRRYAWVMTLLSVFEIVSVRKGVPPFGLDPYLWGLVPGVLTLALIWGMGGLIMAMAEAVGDRELGPKAHLYRRIYLMAVFVPSLIPLPFFIPRPLLPLAVLGLAGLVFVTWLLVMKLLMDTAKLCRGLL